MEERDYIEADKPPGQEKLKIHWTALLRYQQIWPFLIAKLLTDPVWLSYLYWLPSYFEKERGQVAHERGAARHHRHGRERRFDCRRIALGLYDRTRLDGRRGPSWRDVPAGCIPAGRDHGLLHAELHEVRRLRLARHRVPPGMVGLGAMTGGMFITLLAAMIIQWTGNQQLIFICAGVVHPLCWVMYRVWLGNDFKVAAVDKVPDLTRTYKPLLTVGTIIGLVGVALIVAITQNWALCVSKVNAAGAAQAATAAVGVFLIGAALFYAGMSRKVSAVR